MKNFKKHIAEEVSADGHDFSNDVSDPNTISRINAFLGAMSGIEHLVPEHAMGKLRERLGRLGLSFGEIQMSEDGGKCLCLLHNLVEEQVKMRMVMILMMMVSLTKLRVDYH